MYGKLFSQMYTGSMMGSGALMFAVWPYIISSMKPNRDRTSFTVELNSNLMSVLIGEDAEAIEGIIQKCCEPDLKSRTPDKEGRKLVKLGAYLYEVVNGPIYDQMRRAEDLRESNRRRQEKFYHKTKSITVNDNQSPSLPKPKFQKPTLEELKKEGLDDKTASKFLNHYDSNGWRIGGKGAMKDWKAAVRTWKTNNFNNGNRDTEVIVLDDQKPKIRSTELFRYNGFPSGFTAESGPKREFFKSEAAFETCTIAYSNWLEWRNRELGKAVKSA